MAHTRAYATVTLAYWAFMLSDGALRMLVLLHFHSLGFSALSLAYLFLVYELMGVITNVLAGWIGTRYGLNALVQAGLALQITALLALTQLQPDWPLVLSVVFAMGVQGLSGIAKDLIKTGAKSAVKLITKAEESGSLFTWVARLTGSKNAIKGIGFFVGAALLGSFGFSHSLLILALLLVLVWIVVLLIGHRLDSYTDVKTRIRDVFSTSSSINTLAAARIFLFGARDTWFVVAVPVFLVTALGEQFGIEAARAFFLIGAFMALWIIAYGFVQAKTPDWLSQARRSAALSKTAASQWCLILLIVMSALSLAAWIGASHAWFVFLLVCGLFLFGAVFAVNSSLHSYLVLALSTQSRTTMDVGFYYMANAMGRLLGVLLSGISFQLGGLPYSLAAATMMIFASYLCIRNL